MIERGLVQYQKMFKKTLNYSVRNKKEKFDKKNQPHIIRRQLKEIQQNTDKTMEVFAEKIEELSTEAYPNTPDFLRNTISIDAFLTGCTGKGVALVTLD